MAEMVVAPYLLAIVFGLVISLAIYFVFFWPDVEPADERRPS
jgi:hypothetical protein